MKKKQETKQYICIKNFENLKHITFKYFMDTIEFLTNSATKDTQVRIWDFEQLYFMDIKIKIMTNKERDKFEKKLKNEGDYTKTILLYWFSINSWYVGEYEKLSMKKEYEFINEESLRRLVNYSVFIQHY